MVTDKFSAFIKKALHAGVSDAAKFIKAVGPQEAFLVHIRPDLAAVSEEMQKDVSEMSGIQARYLVEGEVIELS